MLQRRSFALNLLGFLVIGALAYAGFAATLTARAGTTPSANTWTCSQGDPAGACVGTAIAPMPTSRTRLAAVTAPGGTFSHDRLVYAIGGYTLATGAVLPTFEAYDPTTNSWLSASTSPALPPLPTARASLAAALGPDGQTIYTFGGANQRQINDTLIAGAVPTVEAFNPSTGTWACSSNEVGTTGCATTTIPPMPTARVGLTATTGADGLIYTFGGYSASTNNGQTSVTFFNGVEAFNPSTGTWACSSNEVGTTGCATTTIPPMPTPRGGLRSVLGPDGQTIYTIGGFTATVSSGGTPSYTYYSVVEAYHPQSPLQNSTWTCSAGDSACPNASGMPPPLHIATQGFGAATAANGAIYAFGGSLNGGPLQATDANQALVPAYLEAVLQSSMPTARRNLGGTLGPDGLIYAIGGATGATPGNPAVDVQFVEAFQPPPKVFASFVLLPAIRNGSPGPSIYLPFVSN
jgi:hypothetical protein